MVVARDGVPVDHVGLVTLLEPLDARALPAARVLGGGVLAASALRTLWFHSPIRLAALTPKKRPFFGSML